MKSIPIHFPTKAGALLGFLAMAVVGWNFGDAPVPTSKNHAAEPAARRTDRESRRSRSTGPGTQAGMRLDSIRAARTQEARLAATFSLANSLSPSEIAAWLDGGWFTIRGGPEPLLFRNILLARWRETDPEGLLAWSFKNDPSAAQNLLSIWAEKEPQRLIEFFKTHPDEGAELRALHTLANTHPDLALARLQEMATAGISNNRVSNSFSLFCKLAEKSPAALEAILDSLPLPLRNHAESALCGQRLVASFSTEIRALWDRPDGWKIFDANLSHNPTLREKLFDELGNMPPGWRASITDNYYYFTQGEEARKWLDGDFENLGFTAAQANKLRASALMGLARDKPEEAILRMGEVELNASARQNFIANLVSSIGKDPENAEALIAKFHSEVDQKQARDLLAANQSGQAGIKSATPADWLEKVSGMDPKLVGNSSQYFRLMEQWDARDIAELNQQFTAMPDDKKQLAAQVIVAGGRHSDSNSPIKGEAIRYLVVNPVPQLEGGTTSDTDPLQMASEYASRLAIQDPAAASEWVESLPPGDAKLWAQKNMANNWAIYDPKAAEQWVASLPLDARTEVRDFMNKKR